MTVIIPIIVACCVAFFAISTGVACFFHHRSLRKPVRGIVLREDGAAVVPGRIIELAPPAAQNANASSVAIPSVNNDGIGHLEATAAVYRLSAEEQRLRELHNRRLNAEDMRMAYPMRGNGIRHPLDGTPLARLVTFFRHLQTPRHEDESLGEEEEERAAHPPAQQGGQEADEAANVDYGRYLVAVDIAFYEPHARDRWQSEDRKACEANSAAAPDPFGGRTERDWAALNDTGGIDYMTNEGTAYLARSTDSQDARNEPILPTTN